VIILCVCMCMCVHAASRACRTPAELCPMSQIDEAGFISQMCLAVGSTGRGLADAARVTVPAVHSTTALHSLTRLICASCLCVGSAEPRHFFWGGGHDESISFYFQASYETWKRERERELRVTLRPWTPCWEDEMSRKTLIWHTKSPHTRSSESHFLIDFYTTRLLYNQRGLKHSSFGFT